MHNTFSVPAKYVNLVVPETETERQIDRVPFGVLSVRDGNTKLLLSEIM